MQINLKIQYGIINCSLNKEKKKTVGKSFPFAFPLPPNKVSTKEKRKNRIIDTFNIINDPDTVLFMEKYPEFGIYKYKAEIAIKSENYIYNEDITISVLNGLSQRYLYKEFLIEYCRKLSDTIIQLKQKNDNIKKSIETMNIFKYWDFLYFSIITSTTIGYGDILPNSTLIRSIVSLQSIISICLTIFYFNNANILQKDNTINNKRMIRRRKNKRVIRKRK